MTIYHVALHADWRAALVSGEYRISTLGATIDEVGYIHASEAHQVDGIVERFYRGQQELTLLVIDEQAIAIDGVKMRREDGGSGEQFPHIYGAIRPQWIVAVNDLEDPHHST